MKVIFIILTSPLFGTFYIIGTIVEIIRLGYKIGRMDVKVALDLGI